MQLWSGLLRQRCFLDDTFIVSGDDVVINTTNTRWVNLHRKNRRKTSKILEGESVFYESGSTCHFYSSFIVS